MRMIELTLEALKQAGVELPDNALDIAISHIYGSEPAALPEWSKQDRDRIKSAAEKVLKKNADRFTGKAYLVAEEVVDHLWKIGWEIRSGYGGVIGMEQAVKIFLDEHYPEDEKPMTDAELADPYLIECLAMLKKYYIYPDEREQRMLVRAKVHLTWLEMAIQILRADNAHRSKYEIKNLIPHGQYLYEHRNAKRRL